MICPSAVDTPILDKGAIGGFNGRDYYLTGQGVRRPHPPEALAAETLAAVERNRGLLVTPRSARIAWRVGRLAPGFVQKASARFVDQRRANFKTVESPMTTSARIALVVGGASGIGAATARALVADGCTVVVGRPHRGGRRHPRGRHRRGVGPRPCSPASSTSTAAWTSWSTAPGSARSG